MLEHPPLPPPHPSRPQSADINAISRISIAEGTRTSFLLITLCLGLSSWVLSLVSQAVFAATKNGNAEIRLLWFGIVIQFILLVEIIEVVISRNMFAFATQISIFAALATVFAVLGVDQNIYSSSRAQQAIGSGWIITAVIDLLWIIYFTSPPDSHFFRFGSNLASSGPFSRHQLGPKPVEKISRSQDAFVMPPANGSVDARPGAEALTGLGLDPDEFATLAAGDTDKLKEERMRGPERTSYNLEDLEPRRAKTRSGGLWSSYSRSTQPGGARSRSSGVTEGARGVEKEASALSSEPDTSVRQESETTSVLVPEAPPQQPPHSKATQSKPSRVASQLVGPAQPPKEAPIQWRAEAMFDYLGSTDDPQELSFKKGEHLTIIDKSGKWWEAKTQDGKKGIAPSNYLRLLI